MLSDPQLRVATPPLRPQRYVTEMTRLLGHRGTRQGLGVSCHPWGMTPVFVTPWPLAPRRLSPGELTGASGEHRMPPARHPHGGARVAGRASAPVWARPLAGGLLLSRLVTIHPRLLCESSQSTPGGCSGHRKVCVAEAPRGRRGPITRKQGRVCRWVAPLWLTHRPSAPAIPTPPPTSAPEDCLWGDQQEVQTRSSHTPRPSSSPPTPARLGLDFPSTRSDEAAAALQSPRTASQARMGTEVLGGGQEITP